MAESNFIAPSYPALVSAAVLWRWSTPVASIRTRQSLARREVAPEQREEFASSGRAHRQVSFHKESLRLPAQSDADFMFCGIEAEVVVYFH
jgi:hypothetical protein